jgi:hypothetical protein
MAKDTAPCRWDKEDAYISQPPIAQLNLALLVYRTDELYRNYERYSETISEHSAIRIKHVFQLFRQLQRRAMAGVRPVAHQIMVRGRE